MSSYSKHAASKQQKQPSVAQSTFLNSASSEGSTSSSSKSSSDTSLPNNQNGFNGQGASSSSSPPQARNKSILKSQPQPAQTKPPSQSKPSLTSPPPRRIASPAGRRLATITERPTPSSSRPPSRSSSRQVSRSSSLKGSGRLSGLIKNPPFGRRIGLGQPPEENDEEKPPSYHSDDSPQAERGRRGRSGFAQGAVVAGDSEFDDSEKPWKNLKNSRRGGWKRLVVIAAGIFVIILALALGLGLGLTIGKRGSDDNDIRQVDADPVGTSGDNASPKPFPIGEWSFPVDLTSTATDCAGNDENAAATWTCPPFTTYAEDSSKSRYVFRLIVSSTNKNDPSNRTLEVRSTPDPFSLTLKPTPLNLLDAGSSSERYQFSSSIMKTTYPDVSLTDDGASSICFFNRTTLNAELFTSLRGGGKLPSGDDDTWPGTLQFTQDTTEAPDCYPGTNGGTKATGPRISGIGRGDGECECRWETKK
ncbi:MAG: hypothetical protein M1831_007494 [Alyxoria varia]|nr:MAG: hypothetical protein M1831_007494 [Alyxoria varia]